MDPSARDRAHAELLAIVSHDIRGPLGVILGAVTELADPRMGPLTDTQRSLLQLVRRSGERLSRLAANVLFLNRTAAGALALTRQRVDGRDVARRAVETFERAGELGKIALSMQLPPERVELEADPELAVHALVNVVANAIRFARGEIVVSVSTNASGAAFVVEDDGPGIPEATIPLLFDREARQAQGDQRRMRGLGLLIVQDIVTAHDGSVTAELRLDDAAKPRGMRIRIALP